MFPSFFAPLVVRSRPCSGSLSWRCISAAQCRLKSTFPTALYNSLSHADQKQIDQLRALRQRVRKSTDPAAATGRRNKNSNGHRYSQQEDDFILQFVKDRRSFTEIECTLDRPERSVGSRYRNYLIYQDFDAPREASRHRRRKQKEASSAERDQEAMEILRMANDGWPFARIAVELGLSNTTVRRRYNSVCHPDDRQTGDGSPDVTGQDIEHIKQCLQDGKSRASIAKELGRSLWSIDQVIRDNELYFGTKPKTDFSELENIAIRAALDSKSSLVVLAEQLGRSYKAVVKQSRMVSLTSVPPVKTIRRTTLEERREALRLHDLGDSVSAISSQLGRPAAAIRKILFLELVKLGREPIANIKWTPEKVSQLMSLREAEDQSWDTTAKTMGMTPAAVKLKYGRVLELTKLGRESPGVRRPWMSEDATQLMKLRDEDRLGWTEVAEIMGRTRGSVHGYYYRCLAATHSSDSSLQETSSPVDFG